MVSENLKILLDEFDSEVHTLSEESKEKTEELLKYISNYLRFEYDNYNNLLKDESYINFAKGYNDDNILNTALKQSKADKQYHDTVKAFDTGNMQAALDNFFLAIHSRYDIEKPSVIRYIRKKLNIINELKKQNVLTVVAFSRSSQFRQCDRIVRARSTRR